MGQQEFPTSYTLRRVRVLDVDGGFSDERDVSVVDGRVATVGRSLIGGHGPSFDLDGRWLSPGIFDCHAHVAMSSMDPLELLRTPITMWSLEAARNLRRTLEAGVTSVRDAGGADAGIRDAVDRGIVSGPRLQISVVLVSQTGGHADGFLAGPGLQLSAGYLIPEYPSRPEYLADGVDGMRRVVRSILRAGANWIKLCTTGGFNSPHDDPELPSLTYEEVRAAVVEAGRAGRPVMAHAFGGEGLDAAVEAGVRSIEHGTFLTDAQAARMAERECWLVPTLAIQQDLVALSQENLPDYFAAKVARLKSRFGEGVAVAREHGVSIAVGSDFFSRDQHGTNLRELALLRHAGLTIEETMLAATWEGARLCGVSDHLGRVAEGYTFDAVIFDHDPSPIDFFAGSAPVTGVFKAGRPIVRHPALE
jgi:imidazolonepropionase-like amidohydrolase